jgi:hypothetical protein
MSTVFRGTIKQLFIGEQLGEINNDTADVVSLLRRDEYVYYELCNYRREAGRYFEDSLDIYISPTHTRNEERLYEVGMFLYPSTEVNSSIYPLILGSRVY